MLDAYLVHKGFSDWALIDDLGLDEPGVSIKSSEVAGSWVSVAYAAIGGTPVRDDLTSGVELLVDAVGAEVKAQAETRQVGRRRQQDTVGKRHLQGLTLDRHWAEALASRQVLKKRRRTLGSHNNQLSQNPTLWAELFQCVLLSGIALNSQLNFPYQR